MKTTCAICLEDSDTCVANEHNELVCECCHDAIVRARHLDSQARRERVEAAFAEQDARFERDGKYVPYDPPTPSFTKKQAGQP